MSDIQGGSGCVGVRLKLVTHREGVQVCFGFCEPVRFVCAQALC